MAAVKVNTIRSSIQKLVNEELKNAPSIPVVFDNQASKPGTENTWVQCIINFTDSEYLSLGNAANGINRLNGTVVANVFTPRNIGAGTAMRFADRIRSLYNRQEIEGVYFDAPIGPEVVQKPSPEGFYQVQVRVTFEFIEDLSS